MGTPFISLLEPTSLPWDRALPSHDQPDTTIPRTFLDAMSVREQVFVAEQHVPQSNEFDSDDPRSCHWVIYASVNQTVTPAITDPSTGAILQPRQSKSESLPIGTIRLVPFPHPPHPRNGGIYIDGELTNAGEPLTNLNPPPTSSSSPSASQPPTIPPLSKEEHHRLTTPNPPFAPDRPTTFHSGHEPYLKLGRLAITTPFRRRGIARQLIQTALAWARTHPQYFDPSPAERGFESLGMEQGGAATGTVPPRWGGLVCCHAQEEAVEMWEKCGFRVDEGMGRWMEEGIGHVGMFLRVEVGEGEELV
jgi:predicted GNAT family N-acyltransferase